MQICPSKRMQPSIGLPLNGMTSSLSASPGPKALTSQHVQKQGKLSHHKKLIGQKCCSIQSLWQLTTTMWCGQDRRSGTISPTHQNRPYGISVWLGMFLQKSQLYPRFPIVQLFPNCTDPSGEFRGGRDYYWVGEYFTLWIIFQTQLNCVQTISFINSSFIYSETYFQSLQCAGHCGRMNLCHFFSHTVTRMDQIVM